MLISSLLCSLLLLPALLPTPLAVDAQGLDRGLMGLISTRDIAELTQMATELAAQTMQSNGELLTKPGRPEVKAVPLDARPSEVGGRVLKTIFKIRVLSF